MVSYKNFFLVICIFLTFLGILTFLFEKTEFDTFTYYFSKILLLKGDVFGNYQTISPVQNYLPIGLE